jgi:hypothetical protein
MPLTVTCRRQATAEPWSSNTNQQRTYQTVYRIEQTDAGSRAGVPSMILAAQALVSNALPVYGDQWSLDGDTDPDAYATQFSSVWVHPADKPKFLDVTVTFGPQGEPGKLLETNPLSWPTEYWVEWVEEQVVLDKATNVEALDGIGRAALTLGKVVNACGVEFTEPLMKTIRYPILHAQKNVEDLEDIIATENTYQDTTNNGTFFGAPARTAKFLSVDGGRKQKINGQSFYAAVVQIQFKRATWDRLVLNNGWSHFQKDAGSYIEKDGAPQLFKNKVFDDPQALLDDPDADPDTSCSEPLNLDHDGLLIVNNAEPDYISYRDLEEVDYAGIGIGS